MLEPIRSPLRRAIAPVRALFVSDASAGVLLILVAAAALVVANSPLAEDYDALFNDYLWPKETFYLNTLYLWINDGLMVLFFFVVGLEVKRELIAGQLSSADKRTLPIMAAVAGMDATELEEAVEDESRHETASVLCRTWSSGSSMLLAVPCG